MDRLSCLLDDEGDGRVGYRSLLDLLVNHLGDWTKRLPEVNDDDTGTLRYEKNVHHLLL